MLSDFKVFMRDLFLDLMDRVFLENIFVSSVIIFELLMINRKKLLDRIPTYNLYKYRRFKNFRLFGTLNVTLIIMYILFYSLIKSDIVLLNVLLFMILRAVIIVEVQFAQNALSI